MALPTLVDTRAYQRAQFRVDRLQLVLSHDATVAQGGMA
jgi:hypothetical protein